MDTATRLSPRTRSDQSYAHVEGETELSAPWMQLFWPRLCLFQLRQPRPYRPHLRHPQSQPLVTVIAPFSASGAEVPSKIFSKESSPGPIEMFTKPDLGPRGDAGSAAGPSQSLTGPITTGVNKAFLHTFVVKYFLLPGVFWC